jgi:hypothetical protein
MNVPLLRARVFAEMFSPTRCLGIHVSRKVTLTFVFEYVL